MAKNKNSCPKCGSPVAISIVPGTLEEGHNDLIWKKDKKCPVCQPVECYIEGCHESGELFEGYLKLKIGEDESRHLRNDKFVCPNHAKEIKKCKRLRSLSFVVGGICMVSFILLYGVAYATEKITIEGLVPNVIVLMIVGGFGASIGLMINSYVNNYIKENSLFKKKEHIRRLAPNKYPELYDEWFD